MEIAVVDGQGGGIGRALIEAIRQSLPGGVTVTALGTNSIATAAMLRAGADRGATGENAVVVCAREADVITGSIGIIAPDSMLGELTPRMAQTISSSRAQKVLLPLSRCGLNVAGAHGTMAENIADAVRIIRGLAGGAQ